MSKVPDTIPSELLQEYYEGYSRPKVHLITEHERHNARMIWPDAYPEDAPHYLSDSQVEVWEDGGFISRCFPNRELPAERMTQLPYALDDDSADLLREVQHDAWDPFNLPGGWKLVMAECQQVGTPEWAVSTRSRLFELSYGLNSVPSINRFLKQCPRLPTVAELMYLRNTEGAVEEDGVLEELCCDMPHDSEFPTWLVIDFSSDKARVRKLKTSDEFSGGARLMWGMPALL